MSNMQPTRWFVIIAASVLVCATAWATPVDAQGGSVEEMANVIFGGVPDEGHASVVIKDSDETVYWALHVATYLDLKELRMYRIPFASTDVDNVDGALSEGDHEAAFELLLNSMRLDLGAKYVSDVGLDGINDAEVALGSGTTRDRFHRDLFGTAAEADEAYRQWLNRAANVQQARRATTSNVPQAGRATTR